MTMETQVDTLFAPIFLTTLSLLVWSSPLVSAGYPVMVSKKNDPVQEYMARLVTMVLRHKQCLLYTRVAWKYGCYCGVSPQKCKEPKDCLDECCKFHTDCFNNLHNNCSGLEAYSWLWDERSEEVVCKDCHEANLDKDEKLETMDWTRRHCHCQSCLCDKKLSQCFVMYPCPGLLGYLEKEECATSTFNASNNWNPV